MPGVQLPLNIFEPRYLNMVQAALAGDHLIGMVQPQTPIQSPTQARPDDDASPADDQEPDLYRIGCAGRITSYSETNDGRIVLVLTGLCRFEIEAELAPRDGYRRVRPSWVRFAADYAPAAQPMSDRDAFMGSLRAFCEHRRVEVPWDDIGQMADTDLINLLCAHLPLGAGDKQALIETVDLQQRATLMRGLMDMSTHTGGVASGQRH
ncbi:peptidase S16 [Thiohalocapsa marina]|uniref:Peptidase S16 n=2 Tax=Thiohalocapsa marina TaxID=424902 RepID=A0A5M8FN49_9GAMM|nr:peptidase S16 [Thiohalocapsa marina]